MNDDELAVVNAEVFKHFERSAVSRERLLRLREWAISLVCWDGLLPIFVLAVPNLAPLLFPNDPDAVGATTMLALMIALTVRVVFGLKRLRDGKSHLWQTFVFLIAISMLFLFETFLFNKLGRGPRIAGPIALLVMFLSYLAMMAIALFPFRRDEDGAGTAKVAGL